MRSNQTSSAYNALTGNINLARLEAVKRSRSILLCATTDNVNCNSVDWADGWIVFIDENNNNKLDAADPAVADSTAEVLLNVQKAGPDYLSITSSQYSGTLKIAPRGRLNNAGTFAVCDGRGNEYARALNLQITGIGRNAIDTADDDKIVEDIVGTNISCSAATTTSD